jgi:hypothetical protein
MSIEVIPCYSQLRFFSHEDGVFFLLKSIEDTIPCVLQPSTVEFSPLQAYSLYDLEEKVHLGYKFTGPQHLLGVEPNFLKSTKTAEGPWEPYLGIPGLQVYQNDKGGLCFISTLVTKFFQRVE